MNVFRYGSDERYFNQYTRRNLRIVDQRERYCLIQGTTNVSNLPKSNSSRIYATRNDFVAAVLSADFFLEAVKTFDCIFGETTRKSLLRQRNEYVNQISLIQNDFARTPNT